MTFSENTNPPLINSDQSDNDEDQELYEHYNIKVDKGQRPLRIDKFLMVRIEDVTRTRIQQALHSGNILVNGNTVKPNYKIKPDDNIAVVLPEPPREIEIIPENIPVDIVYEDEDIIVVNKSAGVVVHPGYGNYHGTLLNAITWHIMNSTGKPADRSIPFLVHRIDKNTSGLLLIAKNEISQSRLAAQFAAHSIDRVYNALIWGEPKILEGTITGNIGRGRKDRKIMEVYPNGEVGKNAITHYKAIEKFGYVTLVECRLETGRTHQIRAHFKYLGNPLFNDQAYGGEQILKGTTFSRYKQFVNNCFKVCPRQALHALTLGFVHPTTNEKINFSAQLPADISELLKKWRSFVKER